MLNYQPLVVKAKQEGKAGHEKLRELGTTGIQTPIRMVDNEFVGTQRLHDSTLELGPPEVVDPLQLSLGKGGTEQVSLGVVQRFLRTHHTDRR